MTDVGVLNFSDLLSIVKTMIALDTAVINKSGMFMSVLLAVL